MTWATCELCRKAVQLKQFDNARRDYLLTCGHYYYYYPLEVTA